MSGSAALDRVHHLSTGLGQQVGLPVPVRRARLGPQAAGDQPVVAPGRVVSAGTATRGGREDIQLALTGPARLILAESFTRGRRATCDGKNLGEPEVGDGFGTAWRVPRRAANVTIAFAPNAVNAGYAISLMVAWCSRPCWSRAPPSGGRKMSRAAAGLDFTRAARALGAPRRAHRLPVALAFGFVFAARGVPLFALGTFFILWRGIGARTLALAGGAVLVIAVPVLTLLIRPENRGGYNPEYASSGIAVHWVAVAGIALFVLALSRAMGRPGRARSAPPTGAAPPAPAP